MLSTGFAIATVPPGSWLDSTWGLSAGLFAGGSSLLSPRVRFLELAAPAAPKEDQPPLATLEGKTIRSTSANEDRRDCPAEQSARKRGHSEGEYLSASDNIVIKIFVKTLHVRIAGQQRRKICYLAIKYQHSKQILGTRRTLQSAFRYQVCPKRHIINSTFCLLQSTAAPVVGHPEFFADLTQEFFR